jgi:cysteinyl-tRNA synthetase
VTVQIHNSLTARKEPLSPLQPGRIGMYVCGDTVYDLCHMGHARSKIVFDVVRRYLAYRGFEVTFVRNITDIDDRIIQRAAEQGKEIGEFTEHYIREMHRDYDALGILRPDHEPRATQYVPGMIEMTQKLIEKGHAYVASNGDVMYSVASFPAYGKLSGERLSELRAGERVAVDEAKRDPLDFVLWKRAKPGEPWWPSPWGPGRPGWHIECSVMSQALLGARFDIHGGGLDLKFPHHENEIAQSRAATGEEFAQVWMHNGFLTLDNTKMSKSLGNIFPIRDALKVVRHPEVIRYFVLSSHYRGPVNYAADQLEQADAALYRLYTSLRDVPAAASTTDPAGTQVAASEHTERFRAAMDDDFNTPDALAVLQTLARETNSARASGRHPQAAVLGSELRTLGGVLGILTVPPSEWFKLAKPGPAADSSSGSVSIQEAPDAVVGLGARGAMSDAEVERQVEARALARAARNWAESDRIRNQLAASGVILEDKPGGKTLWRRA